MKAWQTVQSELILDHPILKVEKVDRRLDQQQAHPFIVLHSPDWVNVIPVTADGDAVLIRQWRHGTEETTLEIPGGLIDPGEDPEGAGARELREETGYRAGRMINLGSVRPNPALFDNTCHTYLALDCTLDGEPEPDETERIEVFTIPIGLLTDMVRTGEIDHCVVVAALAYLWLEGGMLAPKAGFMPLSGHEQWGA